MSLFKGESESEKLKIYLITLVSIRSDWEDLPSTALFNRNRVVCVEGGRSECEKSKDTMQNQSVLAQPLHKISMSRLDHTLSVNYRGKSILLFKRTKDSKEPHLAISKTMSYNETTGVYSCQVDEQWFDLSADLLRKALAITPVNPTHPFELPPSGDTVIDFVNELGYPEPVEIVSSIRVNYVYQPWRAILSLLNQCLTGKTSGSD
ncbi:hypothetical protein Tco_0450948 [Tanacetum coccineum]